MHCLEVIKARNRDAVIREAAHAVADGNRELRERILNANPDIDNARGWDQILRRANQEG